MDIVTASVLIIAFALFLEHKSTQKRIKREQRERIRMALRIKAMEREWESSDLESRLTKVQNQINSVMLRR